MRRPHRNIEIFSMSVLDMFASALGAFIMCTIILFPYNKDVSKELGAAKQELSKKDKQLAATKMKAEEVAKRVRLQEADVQRVRKAKAELNQCKKSENLCQAELAKTFLLVQIEWASPANVDLHVTDPNKNEFYWFRTNKTRLDFKNSAAQLSIDVVRGPGIEVWIDPEAVPGKYLVDYVLRRVEDHDVLVTGAIFDRYGRKAIPQKVLKRGDAREGGLLRMRAVEIEIGRDGQIAMR